MFRRKRYAAQGSDMPWWPEEVTDDPREVDPRRQPHAGQYGYDEHGHHGEHGHHDGPGYGPARFGPARFGPASNPRGGPPPLTAHDPFGGWPAFAGDPDAGQGGWTAFAGSPDPAEGGWTAGTPGTGSRGAGAAVAEPSPIDPSDIEPAEHDPAFPLLTHPVGGQRFQPDLEAAAVPTPRGAAVRSRAGASERPRTGRRARRDIVEVEDSTTWLPAVTDPDVIGSTDPADPADLDRAEAAALAGAFATDYLSWDQDR